MDYWKGFTKTLKHLRCTQEKQVKFQEESIRREKPVIVPWTTVPFLSSIETVSLFNFIKNLFDE